MAELKVKISGIEFNAVLEEEKAPKTCEVFKKMLPLKSRVIHVRWSGQAVCQPQYQP